MRKRIKQKIKTRLAKIDRLHEEVTNLHYENYLYSDKDQWYTEEEVTVGRGNTKETFLAGKVNWVQEFTDEEDGTVISINRSEIVRKNGVWLV
jgi:hypothetical protein